MELRPRQQGAFLGRFGQAGFDRLSLSGGGGVTGVWGVSGVWGWRNTRRSNPFVAALLAMTGFHDPFVLRKC